MKLRWEIEPEDVTKVEFFIDQQEDNLFVKQRISKNLNETKSRVSRDEFWHVMVACLLTTQQRSGPNSAVNRFINTEPFPISYQFCLSQIELGEYVKEILSDFGGIRRSNNISDEVTFNLNLLENDLWNRTLVKLDEIRISHNAQSERDVAEFIDDHFKGFGPKQSRNLLQSLGLAKYEIPLDSRITKWLNDFGFPVKLSAKALSDRNYYNFVSDGVQYLCAQSGVYPCVLDAAIFSSFDKDEWSEDQRI